LGADVDGFEFLFGHGCLLKVDTPFIIAQNTPGGKYALQSGCMLKRFSPYLYFL
jgi:hypothetical protein